MNTGTDGVSAMSAELGAGVLCQCTWTQGRKGERGSWCVACGKKVYDVDDRQCQDCTHSQKLWDGMICNRHLMRVTPDMNVTFKVAEGSCWTERPNTNSGTPTVG
jgi:hypothetical protein